MPRKPRGSSAAAATDSDHDLPVAENLLDRQFDPASPNESWVADITYIPTREGWLYLAAVEDLYSRRVVGWSMADHLESRLVVDALELAVQRRLPDEGLLAHSDRGSQYASEHYQRLLAKHGITCSMSRRADCWDNAPMESFFASLKKELVHGADFATRAEARAAIVEYIEVFYNTNVQALLAGVRLPGGVRTDGITINPVSTFRGELQSLPSITKDSQVLGRRTPLHTLSSTTGRNVAHKISLSQLPRLFKHFQLRQL